ncbi:phospholipid-translocating p-type flippase family protein, putative [Ichthyophthirius multifiliis]|uniref:Phospholipid-transporting ATPase n=1 Tax=Ichthyophthirius multifiliis TaxID=5932 RepID=G0QWG4_ICHMU|nr:phospholipid-translocating p-type flippase family protein, putative [Ichthyophthirius multifiliis]EGR30447.1 phospholipid-translocating p-type flippase family protein, putative [Ichthyophthirius multifiliis]|eukprot:XP_004032034.1 phospholipid-translocating p-type flippase family protein, putative [Ichthyophthirius multifiliis]
MQKSVLNLLKIKHLEKVNNFIFLLKKNKNKNKQFKLIQILYTYIKKDYIYDNVIKSKQKYNCLLKKKNKNQLLKDIKITTGLPDYNLCDNKIKTNKYTFYNFLPLNIYQQFTKLTNIYFLFIGLLQTVPQISTSYSIPLIFVPLIIIISISAIKDFYEDYKRMKSDKIENNLLVEVLMKDYSCFQNIYCQDLYPGHIIKVNKNQQFPADILLLYSSEIGGQCYIETKNIDGETALDIKQTNQKIQSQIKNEYDFENQKFIVNYEKPNSIIYRFRGYIITKLDEQIHLQYQNIVLRGCILKNTDFIVGMVLYTGHNCKIMFDNLQNVQKKSLLEQTMESYILKIIIVLFLICIFCSTFQLLYFYLNIKCYQYLGIQPNQEYFILFQFLYDFGNWILIFTNIVPISLIVTLETVKFIQGIIISKDPYMDKTKVHISNLNEQLGQINYIFSDKTGTLTQNVMILKQIAIEDHVYGNIENPQQIKLSKKNINKYYPQISQVDFRDNVFLDIIKNENNDNQEYKKIINLLFMLAACHTVNSVLDKNKNSHYVASSPDEYAIVNFTKFVGVEFLMLDSENNIIIKYQQKKYKWKLLQVFEFNSQRKMQSVIIKNHENKYYLYSKGADYIIKNKRSSQSDELMIRNLNEHLIQFGNKGLRTLMLAERELTEEYFEKWNSKYQNIVDSLDLEKEFKIEKLQDEMEQDLNILGATAIEDKLQDQVPETIDCILKSGIKVWILTGDKIETAINIAQSSKLISKEQQKIIVDLEEENELFIYLKDILKSINDSQKNFLQIKHQQNNQQFINQDNFNNYTLIISGTSLNHFQIPHIKNIIMDIEKYCKTVLCCRVTPKQKQEIVLTVKTHIKNSVTLAVGDGSNDVNMIKIAHVGVGIQGQEGQQAARASDYSIKEFKYLRSLLFYHGRECYRRNSKLVCYNFYKNILIIFPQFWYILIFFNIPYYYIIYIQIFFLIQRFFGSGFLLQFFNPLLSFMSV